MIDSTWVPYGVAMLLVFGACGSDDADDTQGDDGATTAATNAETGGDVASSAADSSSPVDTSTGTGSDADPSTTGATDSETGVDASSSGHAGAAFGEPCHAPEDCASQICFLDQCSQTCESPADCPAPWTCDMGGAISICVLN